MKYFGTEQDCRNLQEAFDYASGLPYWPGFPSPRTQAEQAKYVSWMAANQATRAALQASGQYDGWTLHQQDVYPVDPPGFGWFMEIPDDIATVVVPGCLPAHNRTLSLQYTSTLLSAAATALEALPAQWQPPEE